MQHVIGNSWSASWPVAPAAELINVARADLSVLHVMLSLLVFKGLKHPSDANRTTQL